jgi:porphobilinogen synthase
MECAGPFRDALDSHPGFGDKKTYQQDPSNGREVTTSSTVYIVCIQVQV